jgi:hypothetical protein
VLKYLELFFYDMLYTLLFYFLILYLTDVFLSVIASNIILNGSHKVPPWRAFMYTLIDFLQNASIITLSLMKYLKKMG